LRLLQDPGLRSKMGQAGHAFASENYHQDRVAEKTFEVYQKIAAQEHVSRA
jgi:glycosyltransferase involved in cell wall biosynthesis